MALLESVSRSDNQPTGRIDILSTHERHQLLVDYNDTAQHVPPATLPALFEAQVQRTPDNTAVVFEDATLTYAQLNARANRLARLLIERGVGPEQFVALAVPRSLEMVVAVLAVLKAGAGYLPIDPDCPPARIKLMLEDARPALVLTAVGGSGDRLHARWPRLALEDAEVVEELGHSADTDPADRERTCPLLTQHAAYVIYTSGSTGTPKGVVVSHGALTSYVRWAVQAFPGLRGVAVMHSPAWFDLAVTTLYGPLLAGGCIHLADLLAGSDVLDGGARAQCTFLKATPSHLALLHVLPDTLSPTGDLVVGGEQLTAEVADEWRRAHPTATVINHYGPTETTVGCVQPPDRTG